MKRSKKIALIVAASFIAAGVLLCLGVMLRIGFDFHRISSSYTSEITFHIDESFSDIEIYDVESKINLLPSPNGKCYAVFDEAPKISHQVEIKDGVLLITREDERKWYERIGAFFGSTDVNLYLTENQYKNLRIINVSGSINVSKDFTFDSAEVSNTSGSIAFDAKIKNMLTAETVSGKIGIANTGAQVLSAKSVSGRITVASENGGELNVVTTSGRVELENIACQRLFAKSTSGRIVLLNAIASDSMSLENTSGRVELHGCDAQNIRINTVSGSVSGTLLSGKVFSTVSKSGSVDVPANSGDGICEIKTASGSIHIKIE